MGLFEWLFNKDKTEVEANKLPLSSTVKEINKWREIDGYISVESEEYLVVSSIATAIAAGDRPESEFVVKRILKRNPEVQLVSAIVTSIASTDHTTSKFVIQSIKEKR
ncbi:hypothetical protein ACWOC1_02285 [Enterococcus quebecensis]|uniref:Uncharacterized protein n=1 Tax=Enterococcus quebecensis TaxID=903983 RepID=A0A1E5H2Y3_9ENTE|nr:hypothetical protein [Enterococcus quebecensis]OEG19357.1 hypothetical protein BCR23_01310 [Enterococcus quebecensis]OJG75725.1 hypothetical protein RV12_GL000064 [Enterococcus quebecensis]